MRIVARMTSLLLLLPAAAAAQEQVESVTPFVATASPQTLARATGAVQLTLDYDRALLFGVHIDQTPRQFPLPLWLSAATGVADATSEACDFCSQEEDRVHIVTLAGGARPLLLHLTGASIAARIGASATYTRFRQPDDPFTWYMQWGALGGLDAAVPFGSRIGVALGAQLGWQRLSDQRLQDDLENMGVTFETEWRRHETLWLGLRIRT